MNTQGGALSYTHPGMFGIFTIIEAVRQLRGECGPRQVPGAGSPLPVCEVIIVLGAAVWPHGQPSPALRRRVAHGIGLLAQGRGHRLLCTGGLGTYAPAEAYVMQRLALEAGIPAARIMVEDQATSTFWSAVYCTHLLAQHGWSTALIVTDRYHLPRALWTFRCLGRPLGLTAIGSAVPGHNATRRRWRWYARELCAWPWYVVQIGAWKACRR